MATKKKENLTEHYQYKGEGKLITDKPSKPLKKVQETVKKEQKKVETVDTNSFRYKFNSLIIENNPFILKYKGGIIFDSDVDKLEKLDFQETFFTLNGQVNSYDGLIFKFKR